MSNHLTSMIHDSTGVDVKGGEFINSAKDTNVHKSYYNLNIVFSDVTGFFHFTSKHFVTWIGGRERDPVKISDLVPPDPSALPPVSSIADRYARSMLECMVGYPLYNPKPFSELSMEYPRNGIKVGDVGFIRRDGDFDFLFNICLPQKDFINPFNLPDSFSLETPDHSTTKALESLPHNKCLIPRTVKITESGEYICKGSEGAILELPEGAIQNEAIKIKPFEDLARLRGVQWYEYAMTRGRNVSNGSLYLVTSFTKCTQWGIAVFDRPCDPGQGLTFGSSPFGWKGSRVFTTKVADPNQGDTPNQCVFLRGYKIMIRQDIFDGLCNDQPCGSVSSSPRAGSISLTRQPAHRIRGGGGADILSRIRTVGKPFTQTTNSTMSTMKKSDEVALHANFGSSPFHPSDLINCELLSQNPDAKVALIHDDVWGDLLQDNFPTMHYATLINIAQSYASVVDEYGCVSLEKISNPSKVVDESSRPIQETSALQEPIQGARDEHNPDSPIPAQASTTLQPQSINQSLGAGDDSDESSSVRVALISSQTLPTNLEPYIPGGDYKNKAIEKAKVNETRDMVKFEFVQKHTLNMESENRELELYDPALDHLMNRLKSILQEIPKNGLSKSTVRKTTGAPDIYHIPNPNLGDLVDISGLVPAQKYMMNMKSEHRRLELHDPFDYLMNKLKYLLQEIPNNNPIIRKITGAPGIYQISQLSNPNLGDLVDISDLVPASPSLLPVASIADRYTRSMLGCMVGYPLYNPEPFSEPSMEYSRNGVNVGDVAFVRGNGTFDFLFNICPTQNGFTNPPNLPNGFSLKRSKQSEKRVTSPFPRKTRLFSRTITRTKSGEYICKGSEGAVLELPEGAIQAEAINTKPFEDLAKLRGVQWYKYAMARGRSISNGSLCLITSFTKCTRWGIAVFDRPCDPGQGLKFDKKRSVALGKSTSKYQWNGSCGFITKVADPSQRDATPNQCVFLRGYKIKIPQDIFDNLYNGQPRRSNPTTVLSSSPQVGSSSQSLLQAQRIRGG